MIVKLRKYDKFIYVLLAVIVAVAGFVSGRNISVASAAYEYTDVMVDLHLDETFDDDAYPHISGKYGIDVFQIAESRNGELFIYTYQPDYIQELTYPYATKIRLSLQEYGDPKPHDYELRFLSSQGVFTKFVVDGLQVKSDEERYYEIVCVFRNFAEFVDDPAELDNVTKQVPCSIAQFWTVRTVGDGVTYSKRKADTIEVTDKYVGLALYNSVSFLNHHWTLSFYIAFNTDKPIDKVYEADVGFSIMRFSDTVNGEHRYEEVEVPYNEVTIFSDTKNSAENGFWGFRDKYEWTMIQTVEEFAKSVGGSVEDLPELEGKAFVIRFYEFEEDRQKLPAIEPYKAGDTTILRLKYMRNGVTYNVGVVDNISDGSSKPTYGDDLDSSVPQWVWWLIGGILLIIILILIVAFLPNGIQVVMSILTAIGKGAFFVLSLPFRFVYWIVDSIAGHRGGDK